MGMTIPSGLKISESTRVPGWICAVLSEWYSDWHGLESMLA